MRQLELGLSLKFIARFLLPFFACLIISVAAFITLSSNLKEGIYPVDANSIGILLFESILTSIVLLVFLLIPAVIYSLFDVTKTRAITITKAFAIIFSILAALLATDCAYSWAMPNHYSMAFLYALVIFGALFSAQKDFVCA